MKKILSLMALAMIFGALAPQALYAGKKDKKQQTDATPKKTWKWEMPSKMTGIKDFDHYLLQCDSLNTRLVSYMDSVTFYSVRVINVQQKDGSVVTRRCVVDEEGTIRGTGEALLQYVDMTMTGTEILADMAAITAETAVATASLTEDPLIAFSHGKYLKAGPKLVAEGGKTIKALLKRMNEQKKEIRQYKKDYSESGEAKDPTIDPAKIDSNYSNNEPITKTSEEVDKELAAAHEKDKTIVVPEEGDVNLDLD